VTRLKHTPAITTSFNLSSERVDKQTDAVFAQSDSEYPLKEMTQ